MIYFKITRALTILLEHMQKKFEVNQTKIKGGCQSGRKVVAHNSKSDLPLGMYYCMNQQSWKKVKGTDLPHIITAAKAIIEIQSGVAPQVQCNCAQLVLFSVVLQGVSYRNELKMMENLIFVV